MSDTPDIPELPSDEELGITEDDIRAWEAEQAGEAPPPPKNTGAKKKEKEDKKAAKAAKKAEAAARKAEKAAKKAAGSAKAKPEPSASVGGAPIGDGPAPAQAPAAPLPGGGMRGPVTLALLLVVAVMSLGWFALPSPVPANAPAVEFSSSRAMASLIEVARAAHPPGSPEHDRVRSYLMGRLQSLGLEPTVQETTSMLRSGEILRAATVRNIVARMPGTASTGTILLTAHYDGRELSRAAGDDGIGVVTILEAVRAVQAGQPLRNDVLLLITDAEELGLLGSRAFVNQHPLMADVDLALSVEMRGGGGPAMMFETGLEGGWIVDEYAAASPRPFANSVMFEIYKQLPNDTDFTPFREVGVQGLNFAGIGRAHLYHQAYDTPENVSEATIQHHGVQLVAMLQRLGNEDIAIVDAADPVYFRVPFLGMVVYSARWVLPLAALLLGTFVGVLFLARGRGARVRGMLVGLGVSIVTASLSWGAGVWLVSWLPRFHPERGALHGSMFHTEGWYVMGLVASVFFLTTALFGLARRWYGLAELGLGAAVIPLIAALAATWSIPLGAMNLQWPVLGGLLALAALSGVRARGRAGNVAWILAILFAVPALVLLTPMLELIWLGLNFTQAPWIAVLATVMFFVLLPVLDVLREPNGWWAPVLGVAAAGAFLGVGIVAAKPSAEQPLPSTLIYALDREQGDAVWATQPVIGGDAAADPARAWAVDRAGGTFADVSSMEAFVPFGREMPTTPAPVFDTPPVQAAVTAVSTGGLPAPQGGMSTPAPDPAGAAGAPPAATATGGGRVVRIALRSGLGAEGLTVRLGSVAPPTLLAVNGRPVGEAHALGDAAELRTPTIIQHFGRPDSMVYLDFAVDPSATSLDLAVVESLLRPEMVTGTGSFQRSDMLAPNIVLGSDRVWVRTPVRLRLEPGATNTWAATGTPALPADTTGFPTATPDTSGGGIVADSTSSAGMVADTLRAGASGGDPLTPDALAVDTLTPDSMVPDTLAADTIRRDTIPRDTLTVPAPGPAGW